MSGFKEVLYKESGIVVLISIGVVCIAFLYASIAKKEKYGEALKWIFFLQLLLPILEAFRHPKVLNMLYLTGLVGAVGLLLSYVFSRKKYGYSFFNGLYPGLLSLVFLGLIILAGSWYFFLLENYYIAMVWIEKNLLGR